MRERDWCCVSTAPGVCVCGEREVCVWGERERKKECV